MPSGSQLPGLSAGAHLTLSSLQRFYIAYTIPLRAASVKQALRASERVGLRHGAVARVQQFVGLALTWLTEEVAVEDLKFRILV